MNYLKQRRAEKQVERLWSIVAYATIPMTAVIFISSLIIAYA